MANESGLDDQQIECHLLGLLTEQDTERLDELSIVDDAVAWAIVRVENELVDAYVCRELSGDRLDQFTAVYVGSSTRRVRLEFAEALLFGGRDSSRDHDRRAPARSSRNSGGGPC